MNDGLHGLLWGIPVAGAGLHAAATRADALFALRVLRDGGCGGVLPSAPPLHHNPLLDRTAEEWAVGLFFRPRWIASRGDGTIRA
jgi:hypothetical protein